MVNKQRHLSSAAYLVEVEHAMGSSVIDLLSMKAKRNFLAHSQPANAFSPMYRRMSACRRVNLIGLCSISGLCCLLLLANTNNNSNSNGAHSHLQHSPAVHQNGLNAAASSSASSQLLAGGNGGNALAENGGVPSARQMAPAQSNNTGANASSPPPLHSRKSLRIILENLRLRIAQELKSFDYNNDAMDNNSVGNSFINRTLFTGSFNQSNQPLRSLIVTSWRSGSTFLGDILNALPANYYHYEPLLLYGIHRIRSDHDEKEAIAILKNLLNCDYRGDVMRGYLNYGMTHTYLFEHNERLWSVCKEHPVLCWQPRFLTPFCKLFPLQSMKTVRLRLRSTQQLLSDNNLNVRIVLLVRDPRGTIQSRRHRVWCNDNPDCESPKKLCEDLVDDFGVAAELLRKFPNRFRAIRYEDLSLNPYEMTQSILQFYGLPFDAKVEEFLDTHTKVNMGGVSSTYRDSKSAPFHWKSDLKMEEIMHIQRQCVEGMNLWGYRRMESDLDYNRDFDPMIFPAPFT